MSSPPRSMSLEGFREETPRLKRSASTISVRNALSAKKRRKSLASIDISKEIDRPTTNEPVPGIAADRFIPTRPKSSIHLNTTPRSNKIARVFGLVDDRVFNYSENTSSSYDPKMFRLLRKSASDLFKIPRGSHPTSATANLGLRRQYLLALDAPGVPADPFAYPLSWSLKNCIAVACGLDVFYQNLDSRKISHLCKIKEADGVLHAIEWGEKENENLLAVGTTKGIVQLWDAERCSAGSSIIPAANGATPQLTPPQADPVRTWNDGHCVGGMDWRGNTLAVGKDNGLLVWYDTRIGKEVKKFETHRVKVHGVKWSPSGNYLASSDHGGLVYIWDTRADKYLGERGEKGSKLKHDGPVKALAWCLWKPDLLATGSTYPEGKIRIWSTNSHSPPLLPLHTIPLNTSVTSLHWSPHCKELFSTHGSSFAPQPPALRRSNIPLRPIHSEIAHTMTVHSYPFCQRVLSVQADMAPVGHSCLSPDGTKVFTICPMEETMKMWKVWARREAVEKPDSVFDKFAIR